MDSSAGPGSPRGSVGTCWRSETRPVARWWLAFVATARSPRTSWAAPRRADRGGTGPRPRSPPSGCSTSASWSAVSVEASSASTTWPNAPCRPTSWPRNGRTRSAPGTSSLRPGARSAWPPKPTWLRTTGCRVRSCGGSCRPPTSSRSPWRDGHRAAYADPRALTALGTRARGRSVLLSPFDSLIWYRERVERLFGLRHRLEAYTPKEKRTYGYFAMPVLAGTRIVGLVDPGRREDLLVAKQVTLLRPTATRHVARALVEAAAWVGCTRCAVERVEPASVRDELENALSESDAGDL